MRAMVIHEHGDVDVLEPMEIPTPEPAPGEVRVAVKAIAMNHLDLWVRRGGPAFKHIEFPHRLGAECTGVIDKVGEGVAMEVGKKVVVSPGISCGTCAACLGGADNLCRDYKILGENTQGCYGEYICVPAVNIAPFPERLNFIGAAAGILTYQTAWQMLVEKAGVAPGDWVLVHGAGSGVGVAALQICKLFGARVIATAGSDEKLEKAREWGIKHAINYRNQDFVPFVRGATQKQGVDIVFEHVGGETFTKSIKVVRSGGTLVTCGATAGGVAEIDLRHVFFRQLNVMGSTMGSKATLLRCLHHVQNGDFEPIVDKVFDLEDAGTAHQYLASRKNFGKVVLKV